MVKIVKDVFQSSLMGRELPFRVILPENYEAAEESYPVLYLLHGLFGSCDNWLELTGIANYLAGKKFAVVLPEGYDNWYSDSATIEKDKFESSFITEFIPVLEAKYGISGSREKRAIAGLSMGGFGALKFALKRPDLFIFAGSMSGAFDAPQRTVSNQGFDWEILSPSILKVFGEDNDPARAKNDIFKIISGFPEEKIEALPFIYCDCGTDDGFLKINRELSKLLNEKQIQFEYREVPGGHDWIYWDQQVQAILEIVDKIFNPSRK